MNRLAPIAASYAPAVAASGPRASYRFLQFFTAKIRNRLVGVGQIIPTNPAAAVRGPRHIVRRGKTPVLDPDEARQLIDAIDKTTIIGLRDRALIGLMVYSFARIGAALGMCVEDVFSQNRRLSIRLHEKGGKQQAMPCHHNLETYLHIDGAGLASDPKALSLDTPAHWQSLVARERLRDDSAARPGRRDHDEDRQHTFRATGVTAYLKNGGTLERAAQIWRTMPRPGRRSFTTAAPRRLRSTKLSECRRGGQNDSNKRSISCLSN